MMTDCSTTTEDAFEVICDWLEAINAPKKTPESKIEFLGAGLTYDAYATTCFVPENNHYIKDNIVVRLPNEDAEDNQKERAKVEHQFLCRVFSKTNIPFLVPRPFACIDTTYGSATIQKFLRGVAVELRWPESQIIAPWELVAEIAAQTHRLNTAIFSDLLPGFANCRVHALKELEVFEQLDNHYFNEAKEWCLEHLPEPTPCRVLHGDLLGQNILVCDDGSVGVIDWNEAFIGDPAFDLAIVSRGEKRPFLKGRGLNLFLECYNQKALDKIEPSRVHFYELCLAAAWFLSEYEEDPDSNYTKKQLNFFRYILRRAKKPDAIRGERHL